MARSSRFTTRQTSSDAATHRDWIYDARCSPDGKFIVTAGRDKTVRIWEIATGTFHRRLGKGVKPTR